MKAGFKGLGGTLHEISGIAGRTSAIGESLMAARADLGLGEPQSIEIQVCTVEKPWQK